MARITVVNDYPEFLETMYAILDGMEGHQVAAFEGDETTLDQLIASRPEVMIVDLRMAGAEMKGWDLLVLARGCDELRDVPLIVCSADITTLRERAGDFAQLTNVYTLEKPFSIEDLTTVVRQALDGEQPPERSLPPEPSPAPG
jgi:DNA-binding NtrC family response regulator